MSLSTKQINLFLWVLFAVLLVLSILLVVNNGLGIETVFGFSTEGHCAHSRLCAW